MSHLFVNYKIFFVCPERTERRRKRGEDLEDWADAHRVYKQTKSKRATASILDISRNTVRKLLQMREEPQYNRNIYHSKIESYKEQIIEWRCELYDFNGIRIFR